MEAMKCSKTRVCKMSKEKHLGRTVEEEEIMNEGTIRHSTAHTRYDLDRRTSVVAGHVKISGLLKVIPRDQKHDKLRVVRASSVFTMHTC